MSPYRATGKRYSGPGGEGPRTEYEWQDGLTLGRFLAVCLGLVAFAYLPRGFGFAWLALGWPFAAAVDLLVWRLRN